ncbi:MAG: DUF4421 family protein [Flammeovirgaceae bacterium]
MWPLIKGRTTQFEGQQINNAGNKLTFKPINAVGLGFGLYIFEIGAEITFAIPLAAEREALFGKTKATDLQLNLLGKTWGLDVFYQNYNGFYFNDSNEAAGLPFPLRPDIVTRNLGFNGLYSFNRKFSLRSAYNFSERQRRSTGSFILTGTLNFYSLKGDSAIYSTRYYSRFGASTAFTELDMSTFSVSPGYTYTLVIKRFFVNAAFSVGPALHWVDYQVSGKDLSISRLDSFLDIRVGVGYNGNRFFARVNFVAQARSVKFEEIQFVNSSNTFKLLVGYRFKEFGILKKKASDLLPLIGIKK